MIHLLYQHNYIILYKGVSKLVDVSGFDIIELSNFDFGYRYLHHSFTFFGGCKCFIDF